MKRTTTTLLLTLFVTLAAQAQKFALIDMDYILENIPAYQQAQTQLETVSNSYQAQVEALTNEAKTLFEAYQNDVASLTDAQKQTREEAILAKEKEASELRKKYFGQEGELYVLQQNLLAPIQDKIYVAVKEIALQTGYALVLDRASDNAIIFASLSIDISDAVLDRLGY